MSISAEYTPPSDLATKIQARLLNDHGDCTDYGVPGSCHLADLTQDDIQEILNLAKELDV